MAQTALSSDAFALALDALAPSPNFGPRRDGARPRLVVLHYTGMPSLEGARARLADPEAEVSAHYLIGGEGRIWGMVGEAERAWHAGRSSWLGESDVNSVSIGIELAHPGAESAFSGPPFPERQMAALERVLAALLRRWEIRPESVLAHSDVAPGRKIDPGEAFDWARLARRGLAEAAPIVERLSAEAEAEASEARFGTALRRIGYGDWPLAALLDAFRRRWRPAGLRDGARAAPAPVEVGLAEALAARRAV